MSVATPWLEKQEASWLEEERTRLMRFCTRMTGRMDVGEDLAQECLLEALRHQQDLRDPERLQAWLAGIARNVSLRWLRAHGREQQRQFSFSQVQGDSDEGFEEKLIDTYDFEIDLERKELIELLDRALALLPEETRMLLIEKYVYDSSLSEVAQRLNLQSGAVAMRLQRGKLAFQKVLQTHFQEEIAAYLLPGTTDGRWEKTRVWCPICGRHQLKVKVETDGEILYACPQCNEQNTCMFNLTHDITKGTKSYGKAVSHALDWVYLLHQQIVIQPRYTCFGCGKDTSVLNFLYDIPSWAPPMPAWLKPDPYGFYVCCNACGNWISIPHIGMVWSLPEGQKFWRDHPKMRFHSAQEIEIQGRIGVVSTIESLTDSQRLVVILDQQTHRVLKIID